MDSHFGSSSEVLELRFQVQKLNEKVDSMSKALMDMQNIIQRHQLADNNMKSPAAVVNSIPVLDAFDENVEEEWCLDDDEMMRSLLEDISVPAISNNIGNPLKRKRSSDEYNLPFDENFKSIGTTSDPALVSAVANAMALSATTAASAGNAAIPVGNFEQYVKAVAAIVSCSGISNASQNANILQQVSTLAPLSLQSNNRKQSHQMAFGI